jgi:phage/plasmid-like protein (TIGR03299 family)
MSTKKADVNETFNARRAEQMKGAERDSRGNWVATEGWDANEVIGKDGLDMSRGQAALYTSVPAWHSLGSVIEGGTTDVDTVLVEGGIDFDVDKLPAKYYNPVAREIQNIQRKYVTVRSDNGFAFDVVGENYQTWQNRDAFSFIQELVNSRDVLWESAGALNDGRRTFVCARLPENIVIDEGGANDEVVPILSVLNSHDGTTPLTALLSPWRIVCGNTDRMARKDATHTWKVKHTKNMAHRVEEARKTLSLTVQYFEAYALDMTQLARAKMTPREFDKYLKDLFPESQLGTGDKPPTDLQKRKNEEKKASIRYLYENGENNENIRGTKWAALNSVTEYLDWLSPLRPRGDLKSDLDAARAHAIMDGRQDETKSRAAELLLRSVKR